jgi:heme-degrading monooxygenase HmoA
MYMLLIEGELKPGKKDEFLQAWRSQILPLLKKQDGFIDEFLTFEEGTRKGCGLAFWNSRAQGEHYRIEVFPQTKNFVQHLMHGHPAIRGFEVGAAESLKAAGLRAA